MRVYNSLEEINNIEETVVALGSFDGVHLGHQALIKIAAEKAAALGVGSAVFTFSNHPKDILPNTVPVKNILYRSEKEQIMEGLGVEYLFDIPFTKEIMSMAPRDYVEELLVDKCNAKAICCGFNHRFGYRAEGNPEYLQKLGKKLGYDVVVMEPYLVENNLVSSSLIRTLIASGQVERCITYMGRYYAVEGEVVVGNRLGKSLGFPTSNLIIDESMVTPPNGVYATYCIFNGKRYESVTNVGVKPTVGSFDKNVETHIFDFNKELYGKRITVEFLKKMRDEVKFDSLEDLSEQIVRDCKEAKNFHDSTLTKGL